MTEALSHSPEQEVDHSRLQPTLDAAVLLIEDVMPEDIRDDQGDLVMVSKVAQFQNPQSESDTVMVSQDILPNGDTKLLVKVFTLELAFSDRAREVTDVKSLDMDVSPHGLVTDYEFEQYPEIYEDNKHILTPDGEAYRAAVREGLHGDGDLTAGIAMAMRIGEERRMSRLKELEPKLTQKLANEITSLLNSVDPSTRQIISGKVES